MADPQITGQRAQAQLIHSLVVQYLDRAIKKRLAQISMVICVGQGRLRKKKEC